MNRGRAVILNPSRPDSIKRREFLLDSLRKSSLDYVETVEEARIVIEWQGTPKPARRRPHKRELLPPPVTVEKALRERFTSGPDEVEYWDEMIRLTAEREGLTAHPIRVRSKWETEQWVDTWGVGVGEHLAVNRVKGAWAITHLGTGMLAAQVSRFGDALARARNVAAWPEWATLRAKTDLTPEFRAKARAAFSEVAA